MVGREAIGTIGSGGADILRTRRRTRSELYEERTFLLLGGPFGPFFPQLARELQIYGFAVRRVHLHGADIINWLGIESDSYSLSSDEWGRWIARYIADHAVTDLVVYGDCQFYMRTALKAARTVGAECHVIEGGYFRPDWVTVENGGVNGYSTQSHDADYYRAAARELPRGMQPHVKVGAIMPYHAFHATMDSALDFLLGWRFRNYRWPYLHRPLQQGLGHTRRAIRNLFRRARFTNIMETLQSQGTPYYICLLQREGDSQILSHSPFASVIGFCDIVLKDFAGCAPPNSALVFKNHPLDPGVYNYERHIADLAHVLGVEDRVFFVDGGNFAALAKPARGAITINSTAGISTLQFGVPTIALGRAIYDIPGLTYQGELSEFWKHPLVPDSSLFRCFQAVVMAQTQVNGNFYSPKGRRIAIKHCARRLISRASNYGDVPRSADVRIAEA